MNNIQAASANLSGNERCCRCCWCCRSVLLVLLMLLVLLVIQVLLQLQVLPVLQKLLVLGGQRRESHYLVMACSSCLRCPLAVSLSAGPLAFCYAHS